MECLIGGAFLVVVAFGFILWLGNAIQGAQTEAAPAPARSRSEYGGTTRTVRSTPRQRETAARTRASDRAITTARRQSLRGLPKGTAQVEPLGRAIDYESRKVNAM